MKEDIQTLTFSELDSRLQEKVKKHFSESEYLIPDDWYEYPIEHIKEKYEKKLDIDSKKIEFDIYRNDFNWQGSVNFNNSEMYALIPKKVREYLENSYVVSMSEDFKNGEMVGEYEIDYDRIESMDEQDVMPATISSDVVIIKLKDAKNYEDLIDRYHLQDDTELVDYIEGWFKLFEVAPLFFQDEIEVPIDNYGAVAERILDVASDVLKYEVEDVMEKEAFSGLSDYISDAFDYFVKTLKDEYDYYFTDEYLIEYIGERQFEVIVDESGNQLDIIDLNGEW